MDFKNIAKLTALFYHDQKISLWISSNVEWKMFNIYPLWTKINQLT